MVCGVLRPVGRAMAALVAAAVVVSLVAAQDCGDSQGTGDVYIGGLFDFGLRGLSNVSLVDRLAFEFTAELINNKTDGFHDELLPDLTLQTRVVNSACSVVNGTSGMWSLANDWGQPLHGVIGARCSGVSMQVATLTRLQQIPQISGRSTNPELSDKLKYSHFYRTCAPDTEQGKILARLVLEFGFKKVGVITTSKPYATGIADEFARHLLAANGTAIMYSTGTPSCQISVSDDVGLANDDIEACFNDLMALPLQDRPTMLLLSAHDRDVLRIMNRAAETKFRPRAGTNFIWISTDGWTGVSFDPSESDSVSPSMADYRPKVIGIKPALPRGETATEQFLQLWHEKQRADGVAEDQLDTELCTYCPETADAMVALAKALDASWSSGTSEGERRANIATGSVVLQHLSDVSFAGVSGQIEFDERGDRKDPLFDVKVLGLKECAPGGGEAQGPAPIPPPAGGPGRWHHFGQFVGGDLHASGDCSALSDLFTDDILPSDTLGGCDTGTDCAGKKDDDGNDTPHCKLDSDDNKCVRDIDDGLCSSRPANGDAVDHLTLFSPETVTCAVRDGNVECTDAFGAAHELAERCAEFMPTSGAQRRARTRRSLDSVCCRADDVEMSEWALGRLDQYEIQFGQCDNCLQMLKSMICQVSCDTNNWRFFTGGDNRMRMNHTAGETEDAGVCIEYCTNVFKACRSVTWKDEVRHLYEDDREFCEKVLNLQVGDHELWASQKQWDRVDDSDRHRVCTPEAKTADIHCLGPAKHQALGVASTFLCVFFVIAVVVSGWTPKAMSRWVPPATVTLGFGFLLGIIIKEVVAPLEDTYLEAHNVLDAVQFNTDIFGFLLLPIIIFSSSFNMEDYARQFFYLYIENITAFAVLGTTIAILFTGGLTYAVNREVGGWTLSFPEAMMFGSLISAVDPVATLAAFSSVGVDPRVYSMIYGESILNDAIAIVVFNVFKGVAAGEGSSDGSSLWIDAMVKFVIMSIGSFAVGFTWGILITLLYKIYGDAPPAATEGDKASSETEEQDDGQDHQSDIDEQKADVEEHEAHHHALAEAAVFLIASLSSYFFAEALHVSGIIAALVCGLLCNQWTVRNMSKDAREYSHAFYIVLSEVADHLLMLWVGLLYYFSLEDFPFRFSVTALVMVLISRVLSVGSVAQFIGCVSKDVDRTTQVMMIGAGLRGAVALALVKQMPTSASDEISSATLFIIFWTNIMLGGATTPLVSALEIPNEAQGTLDISNFSEKFDESEKATLQKIARVEKKLHKYLLVNGEDNMDNAKNTTMKGMKAAEWTAVLARTVTGPNSTKTGTQIDDSGEGVVNPLGSQREDEK